MTTTGKKSVVRFTTKSSIGNNKEFVFERKETASRYYYGIGGFFNRAARYGDVKTHGNYMVDLNTCQDFTQLITTTGEVVLWKDVDKDSVRITIESCYIDVKEIDYSGSEAF